MSDQTGNEGATQPPATPAPEAFNREAFYAELDERLAERDKRNNEALLNTIGQYINEQMGRNAPPQHAPQPPQAAEPTAEDYANNPTGAFDRLFEKKMAPLLEGQKSAAMYGQAALIEQNKAALRARISSEEWEKYGGFFEQAIQRSAVQTLLSPQGVDTIWRVTKSHADDYLKAQETKKKQEETKRAERIAAASLGGGGMREPVAKPQVQLDEDQRKMAEAMGLSPEQYTEYPEAHEFEVGKRTNRGRQGNV